MGVFSVSGPRVLVFDDDPVHRMLAAAMLSLWGIPPLLAVDGSEAVSLAARSRWISS